MHNKGTYHSPVTTVAIGESEHPLMVEMTLYTGSPFATLTTIEYGPMGYTSSDGSW